MDFYIPLDGPDNLTAPEARNLWGNFWWCLFLRPYKPLCPEQIKAKFKFFPSLHRIYVTRPSVLPPAVTRPSVLPPAVTTGIRLQGRKVTYFQPPGGFPHPGHIIDPALLNDELPTSHLVSVFGNYITNVQQQQYQLSPPLSFTWSASLPDCLTPPHALTPITVIDKNAPPPSQKCGPKPSLLSTAAMDKARASIKLLLKKCTFEESIIDVSKYVFLVLWYVYDQLNYIERIFEP
jgi:hypothetical protein